MSLYCPGFARNSEGMLKNMLVHEIALLASFYGVTADNIASVAADKASVA